MERIQSKFKKNSECYVVWINPTFDFDNFRIERARYLGRAMSLGREVNVVEYGVDHSYVDYIEDEILFQTQKEAYQYLIKELQDKIL